MTKKRVVFHTLFCSLEKRALLHNRVVRTFTAVESSCTVLHNGFMHTKLVLRGYYTMALY